jgi:hypothetical protein
LNDFSIDPKTNKNQQQSKSEAKAIPREAKVQEWFGESGPGEGLLDLKGVVILSMVFPCVRKRKKLGTKYPKIVKM